MRRLQADIPGFLKIVSNIHIYSFYRIPNDSLNKLFSCNAQFPTVIVVGDFNLAT